MINHTIQALSPISHGNLGADTGNAMLFRRIPRMVNGAVLQVPAISAGALRGVVRRALWREVFDLTGLSRETLPGGAAQWDRLYAALANGGTIEAAQTRVSPDAIRARRAAMPVLSLLGSALYTSHMAGRAKVSNSWVCCSELGTGAVSMWGLLADEHRVRHIDSEEQNPDLSGVGPMPTTIETVIAGASFSGHAHTGRDLEDSAWAHGLDLITYIGGKSGQGFGEVEIEHDGDGTVYVTWLDEHRGELRESLVTLAGELGKKRKGKKK